MKVFLTGFIILVSISLAVAQKVPARFRDIPLEHLTMTDCDMQKNRVAGVQPKEIDLKQKFN
jgi:hypothetical protein